MTPFTRLKELDAKRAPGIWVRTNGICHDGSLEDELAIAICAEQDFGDGETILTPLLEMKCDDMEDDDINSEFIAECSRAVPLLLEENERLREVLKGVLRVADRKTAEFDAARQALREGEK